VEEGQARRAKDALACANKSAAAAAPVSALPKCMYLCNTFAARRTLLPRGEGMLASLRILYLPLAYRSTARAALGGGAVRRENIKEGRAEGRHSFVGEQAGGMVGRGSYPSRRQPTS